MFYTALASTRAVAAAFVRPSFASTGILQAFRLCSGLQAAFQAAIGLFDAFIEVQSPHFIK